MVRINTKGASLIRRAEQILAKHGFPNAKVFRDRTNRGGNVPLLYTTADLNGPRASKATNKIVTELRVEFIGEGQRGGFL